MRRNRSGSTRVGVYRWRTRRHGMRFGFFDFAFGVHNFGFDVIQFAANRRNVVRHRAGNDHGSGAIPIVSVLAQFVNAARVFDLQFFQLHLQLRLRASTTEPSKVRRRLPVFNGRGGLVAGVNPLSNKAMLDALDDDA